MSTTTSSISGSTANANVNDSANAATSTTTVKWRGSSVMTLDIPLNFKVWELKAKLVECTNVEVGNQKLLFKGKLLKFDQSYAAQYIIVKDEESFEQQVGISNSHQVILLMGTPSAAIPKPIDALGGVGRGEGDNDGLSSSGYQGGNSSSLELLRPCGLLNLGNTCYMNATLQTLNTIPEIVESLSCQGQEQPLGPLNQSISSLFKDLRSKNDDAIMPIGVLSRLQQRFPHFLEKNEHGIPAQQDAEECWSLILQELSSNSPNLASLFTGSFETTVKCDETGEFTIQQEPFIKLDCHITQDTVELLDGLKVGLSEGIKKYSSQLGRDVDFVKVSKISQFPPYLMVHFVRFFWKAKEQVKAKILKKVKYPLNLDLSQIATEQGIVGGKVQYELKSVITHIGRSADSGHYISWSKSSSSSKDIWWKFDDEKVSNVPEEDIQNLDGGGDWHIAYLCLYKKRE